MELLENLKKERPEFYPQVVFVDGNGTSLRRPQNRCYTLKGKKRANMPTFCPFGMGLGTHHPQYFGLACHLGVLCDIPTIGIGKTFLSVDGL